MEKQKSIICRGWKETFEVTKCPQAQQELLKGDDGGPLMLPAWWPWWQGQGSKRDM